MAALLPTYVDGLGSEIDRARVSAHLERCSRCRRVADAQRQVRHVLRTRHASLCGAAPEDLAAQVRAAASSAAIGRRGRLTAMAAAAGLVLAIAGGLAWATGRSSVLLAAQLTIDHIKCFMIDGDDHAAHFTPAAAQARMQEEFGWSVPVPAAALRPDVHLVSVRRCLYGQGMVAHLLYRVGEQSVSLFVLPGRDAVSADLAAFGRHAEVLARGGVTYVLVAPAGLGGVAGALGLEAK